MIHLMNDRFPKDCWDKDVAALQRRGDDDNAAD